MIDQKSKDFEAGVSKIKIYLKFHVVSNWRISFTAGYFSETTEKRRILLTTAARIAKLLFLKLRRIVFGHLFCKVQLYAAKFKQSRSTKKKNIFSGYPNNLGAATQ